MNRRRRLSALGAWVLAAALAAPALVGAEDKGRDRSEKEPILREAGREVKDTAERAARKLEERGPKLPREVGKELEKAARKIEKKLAD